MCSCCLRVGPNSGRRGPLHCAGPNNPRTFLAHFVELQLLYVTLLVPAKMLHITILFGARVLLTEIKGFSTSTPRNGTYFQNILSPGESADCLVFLSVYQPCVCFTKPEGHNKYVRKDCEETPWDSRAGRRWIVKWGRLSRKVGQLYALPPGWLAGCVAGWLAGGWLAGWRAAHGS